MSVRTSKPSSCTCISTNQCSPLAPHECSFRPAPPPERHISREEVSTYRHLLCAPLKNGSHGWKNSPPVSTRLPTQSSTGASSPTTPSGDLRAFWWRLHGLRHGSRLLAGRVSHLLLGRPGRAGLPDTLAPAPAQPACHLANDGLGNVHHLRKFLCPKHSLSY
jgi:hypothetical protein